MPIANDVHGHVFKNSSVVLLARLVGEDGQLVTTSTLSSINYTIYELDEANGDVIALGDGETLTEVYTYAVTDVVNADTTTLTVTITGANKAPATVNTTHQRIAVMGDGLHRH